MLLITVMVSYRSFSSLQTTTVASGDAGSSFDVQSIFSSTYTIIKVITNHYGTATSRDVILILYNTSTTATTTYSYSMVYQFTSGNQQDNQGYNRCILGL